MQQDFLKISALSPVLASNIKTFTCAERIEVKGVECRFAWI